MKKFEIALQPEEAAGITDYKQLIVENFNIPAAEIKSVRLHKRAIDARGRQVKVRIWLEVFFENEVIAELVYVPQYKNVSNERPVFIIGCGPAGLFAALKLVELGLKPVIIERGKDVRSRRRDLALLNKTGVVNPDSNYCFGEGGAGTYSDGKLYTRSTKRGDVNDILNIFISHGASPDILIDTHPHIGTNKLPQVITAIRETIINFGGEIHFETALRSLIIHHGKLKGIIVSATGSSQREWTISGDAVILATGHSARDIFELLNRQQVAIEAKALAIGIRIEHPQRIIDAQQYHCVERGPWLPPASYSLTYQGSKKSAYSFCMCPGGIIAPAATDVNEIVVNGWSPSKRNNPFANSGIVANIDANDYKVFSTAGELAALRYQQRIEKHAWQAGGGSLKAPAQRLIDFVENRFSANLPECSYIPGVTSTDLRDILPPEINEILREGLKNFGSKMKGYYTNEAILVGVESRTSSPVRIPRDTETLMHIGVKGLFPCGEGAGYAGGIVSAAIDGQRCAEKTAAYFSLV